MTFTPAPSIPWCVALFNNLQQPKKSCRMSFCNFGAMRRNMTQRRGPLFPGWLTLARNRALDHLRLKSERQRRREDLTEVMPPLAIAPEYEEILDQKRRAERVQALMGSLHPRQKQAIELAYFEGLSHSEIAEALKEPLGSVKSWIRNGLQRLKEGLQATS